MHFFSNSSCYNVDKESGFVVEFGLFYASLCDTQLAPVTILRVFLIWLKSLADIDVLAASDK